MDEIENHEPNTGPEESQQPKGKSQKPKRWGIAGGIAGAVVVLALGFFLALQATRPKPKCGPDLPCPDSSYTSSDSLRSKEVLLSVLDRWSVPRDRIDQVYSALTRAGFDFRSMRQGDVVTLEYRGLNLAGVTYHKDLVTSYAVSFDSSGATAMKQAKQVDTLRTVVRGVIKGSLWNSLVGLGETPNLVLKFAEVLSYEVDFLTESQEGDSFEILLDKYFVDTSFYRDGQVHAVHYRGAAGNFRGFYFLGSGKRGDFFNEKGQSLRKSVLRSPLTFANVTSRFGGRIHPISRTYRQHLGVDYGAPTGTPVAAIADGTITKSGWSGGYGNLVEIRHAGGLSSRYGHLSRYGAGIRSGRSVRQGQTIGYVGSTGYSTGPHLHFETRQRGKPVNPLKVVPPRADPVAKRDMPEFERLKASYLAHLARPAGPIRPEIVDTATGR